MANNHSTLTSLFSNIANSIRNYTGSTGYIVADEFPDKIRAAGENWAGTLTIGGAYASSTYYTESGCYLSVDNLSGRAYITIRGGTSTSYENIEFISAYSRFPTGVSLLSYNLNSAGTSGNTQCYYTAVLTGVTSKINVYIDLHELNADNDSVRASIIVYSDTEEVIPITASNVGTYFTVTNGNYCFVGYGSTFTSNNQSIDDSTATTTLKPKKYLHYLALDYMYATEGGCDEFALKIGTTTVLEAASGNLEVPSRFSTTGIGTGSVVATYVKDSLGEEYTDECSISNILIVKDK